MRAAIYVRISRDREGAGLGVERQEADCRDLAQRLGWDVAEVFTDNDLSAYSGKPRPAYLRLLGAIRNGHIDAVTSWHTDRLHRSPAELETYIQVCDPRGVPTHCVKAGPLDLSSPAGRLVARQLGAVARYESEHLAERIVRQKEGAIARGVWIGGARALGYAADGHTVVAAEAAAIRDAVARVLAGESLSAIARDWTATVPTVRGGAEWRITDVRRVLLRPRNCGLLTHRGKVVEGISAPWPAIITEDEYRAVTAILGNPDRVTYRGARTLRWLGTQLYRCHCGAVVRSGSNMVGPRDRRVARPAYRCSTSSHLTIAAEPTDEFVRGAVAGVLTKHGVGLIKSAEDDDGARADHERRNALRARLELIEDMLGDGELDRPGFVRQRDKITAEVDAMNVREDSRATASVLSGVADAPDPAAAFLDAPVARQRAIVATLAEVTIRPGRRGSVPGGFDYGRISIEPREKR